MIQFLLKNLRGKYPNNTLSHTLRHRLMSYKNENVIGGGLEKPQGGIKEETYFSEQNNNLMLKIREHGTKLRNESCIGICNAEVLDNSNGRTAVRDSCCRNKLKNCLEEAFFLNEQSECCTKLYKEDSSRRVPTKEEIKTDMD